MKKDSLKIIMAFLATALVVYGFPRLGLPNVITQITFLVLLVYIYRAKDSLFWLVWSFAIIDAPGKLFQSFSATEVYRLPMYTMAPGVSVGFLELLLVVFMLKLLKERPQNRFVFKREITLLISTAVVYFFISFFIGISLSNIISSIRYIIPWFWVLIVPRFITSQEDLKRVYLMLVPLLILAVATLLQSYVTGTNLSQILAGRFTGAGDVAEEGLIRVYSSVMIIFISIVLSLYFLSSRREELNYNLLVFIAFAGTVSVLLNGTRGWFLGLLILYSSFLFISGFGFFKQLGRLFVIVGFSLILTANLFPRVLSQGNLAFQRIMTLENLLEGDITAGGTLSRITDRSPRVMAVFRESPVIGWGFSNRFYSSFDGHVANQNNLMQFGILGFIAINLIYLSICLKTYSLGKRAGVREIHGNSHLVFFFALIGLFVIHSTSGLLWGFLFTTHQNQMLWAYLFAAINVALLPDTRVDLPAKPNPADKN